ncbi:unnamed protein product [Spodoptera littoralis]|uniref:Uncharacterized protein n=1 Tax=Spodoptera littoralis TaxID=7109 RepID=A0A9P0N108_SPOLI|nr:unnamed protein product [Spodoptera littoralis]
MDNPPIHTKVAQNFRPCCVARSWHTNILFAWLSLRGLNSVLILQSC